MGFPHHDAAPEHAVDSEGSRRERFREPLEIRERIGFDRCPSGVVQLAVVQHLRTGGIVPHNEIHLERLGTLSLVWQDSHAHVKLHADERNFRLAYHVTRRS